MSQINTQASDATARARDNWLAVTMIALGTLSLVTLEFLPIGLLTQIAGDFGASLGAAGWTVTLPGLVAAVVSPVFAVFVGHVSKRTLIPAMTVLMCLSALGMALADSLPLALVSRLLLGVAVGGVWTFAASTAVSVVQGERAGVAIAIVAGGISIGTVLGVPIGTLIGQALGWRSAFVASACASAAVAALQWWSIPSRTLTGAVGWNNLAALFQIPGARQALAVAGLLACTHFMAYTFMAPMLQGAAHLSDKAFSATFAAYGVAGMIGVAIAGRRATRSPRKFALLAALILGTSLLCIALFAMNTWLVMALVSLWGLAFGAIPVSLQIWLQRAAPDQFEAGSSVMVSIFQVFLATGSALGGVLTNYGGVRLAFFAAAGLTIVLVTMFQFSQSSSWPLSRREPSL